MDFINKLDRINFLATYSLIQDIDSEKNISPDSIRVPLLPVVIKYRELFPIDAANMRDNYVRQRYKVAKFLLDNNVLQSIKIIKGMHAWDGELKIEINSKEFEKTLSYMHDHYSEHFEINGDHTEEDDIKVKNFDYLNLIFEKFHEVATKLKERYDERDTLIIEDEYDVQDLLRCLLILFFSDVRTEEWTPSWASSSSRMDFLLKEENIVIETKKTAKNRKEKKISEELIIDITKYKGHKNCKTLICFIYDPDNIIRNRGGFIKDLESMPTEDIKVKIIVKPEYK